MKKTILLLALAGSMIAGMASCKKEETPAPTITQTIDVSLKVGESYTFSLPENQKNDPYEITTQAKHANISEVGLNSSGDQIYAYTPATAYSGSDQVIVSNDPKSKQGCAHPQGPPPAGTSQGSCTDSEEDHYIVIINFTVKDDDTTVSR